jgi:hypothetical protein
MSGEYGASPGLEPLGRKHVLRPGARDCRLQPLECAVHFAPESVHLGDFHVMAVIGRLHQRAQGRVCVGGPTEPVVGERQALLALDVPRDRASQLASVQESAVGHGDEAAQTRDAMRFPRQIEHRNEFLIGFRPPAGNVKQPREVVALDHRERIGLDGTPLQRQGLVDSARRHREPGRGAERHRVAGLELERPAHVRHPGRPIARRKVVVREPQVRLGKTRIQRQRPVGRVPKRGEARITRGPPFHGLDPMGARQAQPRAREAGIESERLRKQLLRALDIPRSAALEEELRTDEDLAGLPRVRIRDATGTGRLRRGRG